MTILVNITFEIVTEESAENGETAESGFLAENSEYTFRELVETLRDKFTNASCWPVSASVNTWFTNDPDTDFRTRDVETESIHYSRDNPPKNAKYWEKAIRAAFKGAK
jgi:hypothetical protein